MADKKPTADTKDPLAIFFSAPSEALRTLDALTLSSDAQTVLSVLDEAARLKRQDDLANLSYELQAEEIRKEDERLQLAIECEQFNRIERDEMARLSARAKWDASQQTAQAVPAAAPPAPVVADSASDAPDTSKGTPPKLNEVDKAEIQRLYNRGRGASVNAMAKQFNVSRPTIEKVLQRAGIKK